MKPTDFAKYLTEFLSIYLPNQKNVSKNTIYSYRDTFKLLINYCKIMKAIPVEKITLNALSRELLIDFLQWLEINRHCSISTRNQRLAAIHSFFRYIQAEEPTGIFHYQKIATIPIKKAIKTVVAYLTPEAMQMLLSQPDKHTPNGRRDLTLLSVLYDSGARVQELIDLKVCDIILQEPAVLTLTGKGNKSRRIPIMKNTLALLQNYILENKLDKPWKNDNPVFINHQYHKLTKEGIAYIISKYVVSARQLSTSSSVSTNIIENRTPHTVNTNQTFSEQITRIQTVTSTTTFYLLHAVVLSNCTVKTRATTSLFTATRIA